MTHEHQSNSFEQLLQLMAEEGFEGMAEAMKLERSEVLGASPYERTESRRGPHGPPGSVAESRYRSHKSLDRA